MMRRQEVMGPGLESWNILLLQVLILGKLSCEGMLFRCLGQFVRGAA